MKRFLTFSLFTVSAFLVGTASSFAHYPLLDCQYTTHQESNQQNNNEIVSCEAGFSDRSKAPNVVMEVFSEDDEVLAQGHTDDKAMFQFDRPDGAFFIIMDAGPGHVLEISDEDIVE